VGENLTGVTGPRDEDLLSRLVVEARQDLQRRRALIAQELFERAVASYTPRDFKAALAARGLAVIAEMKQRTPSMGVLVEDYRPADLAHAYADGGATAISVLTHMAGFGGRPEHIQSARAATTLPILRKDFVTDPYEVGEARAAGADAVLLIVAALDREHLAELLAVARSRGIAALVEVHDEAETRLALEAGAQIIGVNHRDLRTFAVDLGLTERLRKLIPPNVVVVAESGIRTPEDARRMYEAGADAILVGELLMRSADPAKQIRELTEWSA
jgi:indole-3-glycerol phosphate synthase